MDVERLKGEGVYGLSVPVTTRNWNTMTAVAEVLGRR
jgi:hypothetical protein